MNMFRSDEYNRTGHPCRADFDQFASLIGIVPVRSAKILDRYMTVPEETLSLLHESFLPEKMQRSYLRIVKERVSRFCRV